MASDVDDPTEDPRIGKVGKQTISDTGPLTRKRMETVAHDLFARRYNNWKVHFLVKDDWFAGAMLRPTVPRPVNLRNDPFEQHMDAPGYPLYAGEKLWTVLPAAALVQQHAATFVDFPPRQPPPEFNPQEMLERVLRSAVPQ